MVGRRARRRLLLHAEGRAAVGALLLGARPERRGAERLLLRRRTAKSPALAHQFINFFLDEQNAYDNFVNFTGYTPPQKNIDADALLKRGLIPKSLTQAVVRQDQFAANQELLQLSVQGQRFWDDAWSKFKVG